MSSFFIFVTMRMNPIGIFDSGAGGLSIWREINGLMPKESTVYISDSKYAPYGPKGEEFIRLRAIANTEWLIENGAKIIVVACNTATTNAISYLRNQYDLPFIGIEPAIKPAALKSTNNAIGILATKGTLSSSLFHETSARYTRNMTVVEQVGDGIVELIESGKLYSNEMKTLLRSYLTPMLEQHIDCLVLGCTHYHFLTPILKELIPKEVAIIDSGVAVARQTHNILIENNLINASDGDTSNEFYTNGSKEVMANLLKIDPSDVKLWG